MQTVGWRLAELMRRSRLRRPAELRAALRQRGISLSRHAVYRLMRSPPERLSLATLAALCDLLDCTPNDLLVITRAPDDAIGYLPPPPPYRLRKR